MMLLIAKTNVKYVNPSINRIVIGIRIDATSQQAYRNFAEVHQPEKCWIISCHLRLSPGEYDKLLAMDTKIAQANIIDYITFLTNSDKCPLVQCPREVNRRLL